MKKSRIKCGLKKRLLKFFVVLVVAIVITIFLMQKLVNPIIYNTGTSKIKESTNYAINYAVNEAMKGTVTYDDLVHIVTDASGKITMLQANSIQINSLSRKVIDCAYAVIMDEIGRSLSIPLGSFSGIPIFSGLGPSVIISIVPYGSVSCMFLSQFISAGINQTVHKIYLSVTTSVSMILPFREVKVEENTEVLISESLIIGEIPDTYLMAEDKSDMLNMVG